MWFDLDQCLNRLEEHCAIGPLNASQLTAFKHRRNRFEHSSASESKEALESSSVYVLSEILDFIKEELQGSDFSKDELNLLQQIRTGLADFERFTSERMVEIEGLLTEHRAHFGRVVVCPSCMQAALMADCDVECAFCGYRAAAEEAAELYIANTIGESRLHYMDEGAETYPLRNCPHCDNEALVFEESYSERNGICFACGDAPSPGEYVSCDQCGELCRDEDRAGGMCPACFSDYVSAND